jgi:hypothetical protein
LKKRRVRRHLTPGNFIVLSLLILHDIC